MRIAWFIAHIHQLAARWQQRHNRFARHGQARMVHGGKQGNVLRVQAAGGCKFPSFGKISPGGANMVGAVAPGAKGDRVARTQHIFLDDHAICPAWQRRAGENAQGFASANLPLPG